MPWKASSVMEERLRFVARLLDGEAMTDVCRDFGISRKTGYKIFAWAGGSERSLASAGALRQPAAAAGRGADCPAEGREGAQKIRELLADGSMATSESRPRAPSMRFLIVTAWSSAPAGRPRPPNRAEGRAWPEASSDCRRPRSARPSRACIAVAAAFIDRPRSAPMARSRKAGSSASRCTAASDRWGSARVAT
jgi:transposase-like protein